jgi:molybdopterin-guanine dinucleotide biosynthesis protein A
MLPRVRESGSFDPEVTATTSPSPAGARGAVSMRVGEAAHGRWLGVVLCGGASRRMGRDKACLEVEGEAFYARVASVLAELCAEVVLASGPTERLGDGRWREVTDVRVHAASTGAADQREGPLAALVAGLELAARNGFDGIVTAPCDVPRLAASALRPLQRAVAKHGRGQSDAAEACAIDVAHWRIDGRDEPLCAALSVRALAPLAAAFERGVRRPTVAYAELSTAVHEAPEELAEALTNVNTPDELASLARRSAGRSSAHPDDHGVTNPTGMADARTGDVA